jgi:hypothetical protein
MYWSGAGVGRTGGHHDGVVHRVVLAERFHHRAMVDSFWPIAT